MNGDKDRHANSSEQWIACPPGTFDRVKGNLPAQTSERDSRPYVSGLLLVALVACVLFGFSLVPAGNTLRSPKSPSVQTLSCAEAVLHFAELHANDLNEPLRTQVVQHLQHCDHCRRVYQATYRDAVVRRIGNSGLKLWLARDFGNRRRR